MTDTIKTHRFLVSWDQLGLETLIDMTSREHEAIISALKGEQIAWSNPIQFMILRAQLNPQRHYEIYIFDSELEESEIREFFEHSPQTIADAIRNVGQKIFSDRVTKKPVIT